MSSSTTPEGRPLESLVLMNRETFAAQFDAPRLHRLGALTALGSPIWTDSLENADVRQRLAEVEVLVTSWGASRIDAPLLGRMPRLRGLFHCAGTVRPIVTDAFWERDIVVSNVADANAVPVAEFTFAAVVMAGKKAPFLAAAAKLRRDEWSAIADHGELSNLNRVIGVVGFSRVGRRVVALLQQLEGVRVLVSDPYADPYEVAAAGARLVPLEEMLPQVHVLSIHAPSLPSTRHMIGRAQLAALPEHATLINTARGALVDTRALEVECATGRIFAMLDVTDPEPLPHDSILYDLPNVMITPHIAGSLGSELDRMTDLALDELERFVTGAPLQAEVTGDSLRLSA